MLLCLAASVLGAHRQIDDSRLKALSIARASFDKSSGHFIPIFEMLSPQGAFALYPVGQAKQRYMVDCNEGPQRLVCEHVEGTKATIDWIVPVEVGPTPASQKGTLSKILAIFGDRVSQKAKLTKAQREALSADMSLVYYADFPIDGSLTVAFFKPDGAIASETRYAADDQHVGDSLRSSFPIPKEEVLMLHLGTEAWPGPGGTNGSPVEHPFVMGRNIARRGK